MAHSQVLSHLSSCRLVPGSVHPTLPAANGRICLLCPMVRKEEMLHPFTKLTSSGTIYSTSPAPTLYDVWPFDSRPLVVLSRTQRSLKKASSQTYATSSPAPTPRWRSQRAPSWISSTRTTVFAHRRSRRSFTGTAYLTTDSFWMRSSET